ncbi:MAG: hypothetical protein ACUZ8H_04300 [Candidatus Anammoxibacter sp.]
MLTNTVEDLVAHKLKGLGFLVLKPKSDRDETDLVALLQVRNSVKFCRVQCKVRILAKLEKSYITIQRKHVSGAFILFLNIVTENKYETNLYCFINTDIKKWKRTEDIYYLPFDENNFKEKLEFNVFNESTTKQIERLIKNADIPEEYHKLI